MRESVKSQLTFGCCSRVWPWGLEAIEKMLSGWEAGREEDEDEQGERFHEGTSKAKENKY